MVVPSTQGLHFFAGPGSGEIGTEELAVVPDNIIVRADLNLIGTPGQYAEVASIKGLDFFSNSDRFNANEPIRFRVGNNNTDRTIALMNFDGLTVNHNLRVTSDARFERNLSIEGFISLRNNLTMMPNTRLQNNGPVILRADADRTGDDRIEFRNSSDERMVSIQDGNIDLFVIGNNGGGEIRANGILKFKPDTDRSGDDRISFFNNNNTEMVRIQDGIITTDEVRLNVTTFPDYVFAKDYDLMPLEEVAAYIKTNKHLPKMPTEAEVVKNGMNVSQINTILVEKVEELTLYTINQEQKIEVLLKKIKTLEATINK